MAVEVGVEGAAEVEVDALREAYVDIGVDVCQAEGVGGQVVARAQREVLDEADLLGALGAVALALDLHLQVVVHAEGDEGGASLPWPAEEVPVGVARIALLAREALLVRIAQRLVEAPHGCAEVGGEAHPDARRHAVAYHLHLVAEEAPGLEEAVERGAEVGRGVEVIGAAEAVVTLPDSAVEVWVVDLVRAVAVPALVVVGPEGQVDIVEELVGGGDGDIVAHPVLPVAGEAAPEEAVLLGGDAIAQLPRVADADLLVPALCPHALLAAEGVDTVHADGHIRQAHRDHGVRGGLRRIDAGGEAPGGTREGAAVVDGRVLGILPRHHGVVECRERIVVVAAGRVVDAGREALLGVGLGVLRVRPADAEVFALAEVPRYVAVARLGGEVAHVEAPVVAIALAVVGARIDAPAAQRIPVPRHRQVYIVIEGKVIAALAEVEAAAALLPVLGHDDARGVGLIEGEEAEG